MSSSKVGSLLEQLQARLAQRPRTTALYRVVEVVRGADGRLQRQGQIWHDDLGHVRRFGRALAANSSSQQVLVADAHGVIVEALPTAGALQSPAGWQGWRESPLPALPPRGAPLAALRKAARPLPSAAPAGPPPPLPAVLEPALPVLADTPAGAGPLAAAPAAAASATQPAPAPAIEPPPAVAAAAREAADVAETNPEPLLALGEDAITLSLP